MHSESTTAAHPTNSEIENRDLDIDKRFSSLIKVLSDTTHYRPSLCSEEASHLVICERKYENFRYVILRIAVDAHDSHVILSPREREIARLVAEGYPNKTIAAVLDISAWTVSTHIRRIFVKLNVRSRAAMVARLLQEIVSTSEFDTVCEDAPNREPRK